MNWNLAAARDLPFRKRWPILAGLSVVAVALFLVDLTTPGLQLRPLVFVLLIVGTAFGGMRFGLTLALIAAPSFTVAEAMNIGQPIDYRLAVNVLAAAASFALVPLGLPPHLTGLLVQGHQGHRGGRLQAEG